MTEPSQYFKGRTVQEQMNEVIGYVKTVEGIIATIQGQIADLQTADGENVKINNINQYAVGLTGNQNHIAGVKSFENSLIQLGLASPTIKPGNDEKSVTPPSDLTHNMILVQDDANNNLAGIFSSTGTDGKRHITAYVFDCNGSYRSQVII